MLNPLSWLSGAVNLITALAGVFDRALQLFQRWQDRQAGRNEQRLEEAEHAVANAERINAAVADAPRDAGELRDRVDAGTWKL